MDAERKARLGARHTCFACGTRFYDLNKPDPVCPKCGKDQRESPLEVEPKPKRTRKKAARKKKKAAINPKLAEEDDVAAAPAAETIQELDLESGGEIQVEVEND